MLQSEVFELRSDPRKAKKMLLYVLEKSNCVQKIVSDISMEGVPVLVPAFVRNDLKVILSVIVQKNKYEYMNTKSCF